ncbi:hypothetical protein DSO57_1035500 [Entomophthora muscae]|uniref:Uncharacterized protein n=1 Tax=Entomophthora muscae TaxID=34485 RepID=A0ACC2UJX8_9FUNG|nr:hypothetical protein DSO57_1035500 [Entomophthora muscae]
MQTSKDKGKIGSNQKPEAAAQEVQTAEQACRAAKEYTGNKKKTQDNKTRSPLSPFKIRRDLQKFVMVIYKYQIFSLQENMYIQAINNINAS